MKRIRKARCLQIALLGLLLVAAIGIGSPSAASADKIPCDFGFEDLFSEVLTDVSAGLEIGSCGELSVPLDYAGDNAGRAVLRFRDFPAGHRRGKPAKKGTIVLLAGGPGQAGIIGGAEALLRSSASGYRVIEFNQRGTGEGALRCLRLEHASTNAFELSNATIGFAFSDCARSIGPTRGLYTSANSARDLETLRQELKLGKITVVGVSYGTYVAQVYARMFPGSVDRLVLDSVVGPNGVDPLSLSSLAATRRVMQSQCAAGCAGVTKDLLGDVATLQSRLAQGPIQGSYANRRGKRVAGQLTGPGTLNSVYSAGDFNPFLRSAMPAAVKAALGGDPAAMIRLQLATTEGPFVRSAEFSMGLFAATACADTQFPWQTAQSPEQRLASWNALIDSRPSADYVPYGRPGVADAFEAVGCQGWPEGPSSPTPSEPLPDVPTLLLEGENDLRTPVDDAKQVAALLPHSTVLAVPGAGHSVLGTTECASKAMGRFLGDRPIGNPCKATSIPSLLDLITELVGPTGPIPESINDLRPSGGATGKAGRTATAVERTLRDAQLSAMISASSERFRGLHRGYGKLAGFFGKRTKLAHYSYVPGVEISAEIARRTASIRVRGADASSGRLTLRHRRLVGRIGGQRVELSAAPIVLLSSGVFGALAVAGS